MILLALSSVAVAAKGQTVSISSISGATFDPMINPLDDMIYANATVTYSGSGQRLVFYAPRYYAEYYDQWGNYLDRSPATHVGVGNSGLTSSFSSGSYYIECQNVDSGLWIDYAPAGTSYVVYGYYVQGLIEDANGNILAYSGELKPSKGIKRAINGTYLDSADFTYAAY